MKIEELKAEWAELNKPNGDLYIKDMGRVLFAVKYMDKLLAVAEAAEDHRCSCEDIGISDGRLAKALDDLLESK